MTTTRVPSEAVLAEITDRIVQEFRPLRVILFGSRARGDAGPHSDTDLLVVFGELDNPNDTTAAILQALYEWRGPCAIDVVVTTQEKITRLGNLVGLVYRPALREGRVLYDSGAPDVRCEVSEEDLLDQTRKWMGQARDDLRVAHQILSGREPILWAAAFHSQQAIEKAIKTILIFLQVQFPFVHDLEELLALVPQGWAIKREEGVLRPLSRWATAGRYPGDFPPTEADANYAIDKARAIIEAVEGDLSSRGLAL